MRGSGAVIRITNSGTLISDLQIDFLASTLTQTAGSITGDIDFGDAYFDTLALDIADPFDLGNVSNFETLSGTRSSRLKSVSEAEV